MAKIMETVPLLVQKGTHVMHWSWLCLWVSIPIHPLKTEDLSGYEVVSEVILESLEV